MLYKSNSKIHGHGIFSGQKINSGESFYDIPNKIVSSIAKPRWAKINDKYICDRQVLNYINHSCEPNTVIDVEQYKLTALRNIGIGEEITCDYNKTEINGTKVLCNCGAANCRSYFLREE